MMKRKWVRPRAEVQTFTPNEYVAACWGVACSVDAANAYEQSNYYKAPGGEITWYNYGCTHASDHCGTASNQYIDTGSDNIADTMTEVGTDGLGNLACTLYTSGSYNQTRSISTVKAGDYIYWTTSSGDRVWHHQGTVTASYPRHPNRS